MRRADDGYRGGRGPPLPHSARIVPPPPLEAVVGRLETLARLLHATGRNSTRPEEIHSEIRIMYQDLTRLGPELEAGYPDVLDRVMSSMRDASTKPSLPPSLRLAIFQLVELRASHWCLPQDTSNYYSQRSQFQGNEILLDNPPVSPSKSSENLASDSGRSFIQEITIRNSDSGKVMGVQGRRVHLIETLSDTIISFKKPNLNKRVLTIVGPSTDSVGRAKDLIEDTIRRNASPELDSEPDDDLGEFPTSVSPTGTEPPEFSYSIRVGENVIRISGTHLPFVQEAKLALDEHFLQKYPHLFYDSSPSSSNVELPLTSEVTINQEHGSTRGLQNCEKSKLKYDRKTLIEIELQNSTRTVKSLPHFLSTLDPSTKNSITLQKRRPLGTAFLNETGNSPLKNSATSSGKN